MWTKETWAERVEEFLKSDEPAESKWSWPFPMGVFGTLRENQGNNRLMHVGKVSEHRKGFLRHFYARGLSVGHHQNACAPFEVFYYDPEQWKKMIPRVDALEGFSPERAGGRSWGFGYYRTLVWINLLPKDYTDKWFPADGRASLGEYRDMAIPTPQWGDYEKVPCWVYSNQNSNRAVVESDASSVRGIVPTKLLSKLETSSPLIWPPPQPKTDDERSFWDD